MNFNLETIVLLVVFVGIILSLMNKLRTRRYLMELKKEEELLKKAEPSNLPLPHGRLTETPKEAIQGMFNEKVEKKFSSAINASRPIGWVKPINYDEDMRQEENKKIGAVHKVSIAKQDNGQQDSRPRILLVDDSVTIRKYISNILKKMGFNVYTKNDGQEALEYIKETASVGENFDLIITDIEMPRMDGVELVKNIRGQKNFNEIPILIISSNIGNHFRLMEEEMIQGFMHKPFKNEEFELQVKYLLSR